MSGLGRGVDVEVGAASLPFADPACGQGRGRAIAVKLTDALLGEHGVLYALFDQIEAATAAAANLAQIQQATAVLSVVLLSHANLEEELLFPALEPHMGTNGPLAVMRAEHDEIEHALRQIEEAQDLDDAADRVARALSIVRDHFQKEEEVLFSMARQTLDEETQIRLGKAWAAARRVTIA
jgi:hemerythrin-like domain-containing protein